MKTTFLEHVAERVLGAPLLIMPQKLDVIASVLAGRLGLDFDAPELGLESFERPEPLASRFVGRRRDPDTGAGLPYVRTDAGTALITITGSLVNRGAWIGANSGLTSYEGIAAQIRAAQADPKVSSIVLDLNTPGGEATGAFELAELVRQGTKPVTAFINGLAASAGYLIASGAGTIISVPSGITGSIGVVRMHADYSRALETKGVKPTLIHSGKHKVEGNPFEPLSAETKARLQADVDGMREEFVQAVAAGRGRKMSAKAARDTEAAVFTAKEAKQLGLVDDIASFDAFYDAMNRSAAKGRPAKSPHDTGRRASMEKEFSAADLDTARSTARAEGHAAGLAEGKVAGMAEGAKAERTRLKAIVGSAEAKGREQLAAHFAYDTDMSPDAADAALKASAKAAGGLADRAAKTEQGFHTAGTSADAKPAPVIDAVAIYANMNKRVD